MAVKIQLNHNAIAQYLRDPTVLKALKTRADAIATAAGPGYEASTYTGRRARASVITATMAARADNARRNTLLRATGAGRHV